MQAMWYEKSSILIGDISGTKDVVKKEYTYVVQLCNKFNFVFYPEIQALWLIEQQQQRLIFTNRPFWQGKTINVWAYNSGNIIGNFNFIAPNSNKMSY